MRVSQTLGLRAWGQTGAGDSGRRKFSKIHSNFSPHGDRDLQRYENLTPEQGLLSKSDKTKVLSTSWVSFIVVYEIGWMLVVCRPQDFHSGISKKLLGREGGSENQAPG